MSQAQTGTIVDSLNPGTPKAASAVKSSTVDDASVAALKALGVNKKAEDLNEVYIFNDNMKSADFFLVNTSGKVVDTKSKNKDGNDYYYVVEKGGRIAAVYVEN